MGGMPIGLRTAIASLAGSLWRILITPIDTWETTLQVQGKEAMAQLGAKIKNEGPMVLYQGALANALASFVGSYPWYFVFNSLQEINCHNKINSVPEDHSAIVSDLQNRLKTLVY